MEAVKTDKQSHLYLSQDLQEIHKTVCARFICCKISNEMDRDIIRSYNFNLKDLERFGSMIFVCSTGDLMLYNRNKKIYFTYGMASLRRCFGLQENPVRTLTRGNPELFIRKFCIGKLETDIVAEGQISLDFVKLIMKKGMKVELEHYERNQFAKDRKPGTLIQLTVSVKNGMYEVNECAPGDFSIL